MMRYVRDAQGIGAEPCCARMGATTNAAPDLEVGAEVSEGDEELPPPPPSAPPATPLTTGAPKSAAPAGPTLPRFIPAAPH
jgi:hypothetical protein